MSIETKERGPDVAFMCILLVGGCAFAYWLDFGFTRMDNQISWVSLPPFLEHKLPANFLSEIPHRLPRHFCRLIGYRHLSSARHPRWYFARRRNEEGLAVLARLYDRPADDPEVQELMQSILISIKIEEEDEHKFNYFDLFWDRSDLRVGRRIRIAFLILSMQQMMGE